MGMSSAQTVEIDEQDVELAQETVHGDDIAVRTLIDRLPDRLAESRLVDIRISIPLGFDRFLSRSPPDPSAAKAHGACATVSTIPCSRWATPCSWE